MNNKQQVVGYNTARGDGERDKVRGGGGRTVRKRKGLYEYIFSGVSEAH